MDQDFITAALDYHRSPTRGKISVVPTKGLTNQRDLALAYSPGVAAACDAIVANPAEAFELTSRGNLVAVVTNGTAVLGLGNIGPLAGKPVMEGKGCLFKKFAGVMCLTSSWTSAIRTNSSTSLPPWSPHWAASTWKTSKRPSASTLSKSCPSA